MDYQGKPVHVSLMARLIPPDPSYPDCVSHIYLLDNYLYVLEDEYNGQYITHFAIPLKHIQNIGEYTEEPRDKNEPSSSTGLHWNLLGAIFGMIGGTYAIQTGDAKNKGQQKYLKIDYMDDSGQDRSLFFQNYTKPIKKLKQKYEELR